MERKAILSPRAHSFLCATLLLIVVTQDLLSVREGVNTVACVDPLGGDILQMSQEKEEQSKHVVVSPYLWFPFP